MLSFTFFFLCTLYIVTFCCSLKECPAAVHSSTLQTKLAASEAYAPKEITRVGLSMIISSLVHDYLCWFCFGVPGLWAEQWAECSENCSKHMIRALSFHRLPSLSPPRKPSSRERPSLFIWKCLTSLVTTTLLFFCEVSYSVSHNSHCMNA